MAPRKLPETMQAYRIGDPAGRFPVWSAQGARGVSGRWHETGSDVIYASEHYSTAMLEKLVHWNGTLPPNQHFITVTVPKGTSYEVVTPDILPNWHRPDGEDARRFGRTWYREMRSALLIVPSVVARMENNLLLNALHPDFANLTVGLETPVWWDRRLFE
jgi:RES domain-containing protein